MFIWKVDCFISTCFIPLWTHLLPPLWVFECVLQSFSPVKLSSRKGGRCRHRIHLGSKQNALHRTPLSISEMEACFFVPVCESLALFCLTKYNLWEEHSLQGWTYLSNAISQSASNALHSFYLCSKEDLCQASILQLTSSLTYPFANEVRTIVTKQTKEDIFPKNEHIATVDYWCSKMDGGGQLSIYEINK